MSKLKLILSMFLLVAVAISGCASPKTHSMAINMISPALPNIKDCLLKQKSGRVARDGLAGDLLLFAALTEMSPDNYTFLYTTALAYTAMGLLVEDEDKDYASELFLIAKDYGLRALMTDKGFKKEFEKKGEGGMADYIKTMDKKYVPALFWTAMPYGLYMFANLADPASPVGLPIVVAMVERSRELQPDYFFGAPHLFFVAYNGYIPEFLGGGPDKAEESFKKCLAVTDGNFLLAHVYYSQFYLRPYQKKDEFLKELQLVLDTPTPTNKPELNLVNEIARRKARILLDKTDELFIGGGDEPQEGGAEQDEDISIEEGDDQVQE